MNIIFGFFCRDVQSTMEFYQQLFGWPEREADRSAIYRALESSNSVLGFHAYQAYQLLGLSGLSPQAWPAAVTAYPTVQLGSPGLVDELAAKAEQLGGTILKRPFATYYGQWQAVLADIEGHVFRLASAQLPPGAQRTAL